VKAAYDLAVAALPKAGGVLTGDVTLDNQFDLRFREATANGTNYVGFQAPATVASDVLWTLPAADGTAAQVLSTNGSGTLSWATGGAGTTPTKIEVGNTKAEVTDTGSNGTFTVTTEGTGRLSVDSSGRTLFGGVTANANGGILQLSGGITFPATAVAATDVNTLDDYEEGTWTPDQGGGLTVGGTFVSSGTYTKIGRQLFISGQMSAASIAVAAGGIISTNLPFSTTGYGTGGFGDYTLTNGAVVITASLSIYSVAAVGASGGIEFAATCIV
jgi:hypothetical protein